MNILHVTPRFLPSMGGVELHVFQVCRRLARNGVSVTVLTTDGDGKYLPQDDMQGVHVIRTRAWPQGRDYFISPGIYTAITRGGWDLVHVQSYHTFVAPLAMFAAWRSGIPYVVTFHGGGHSSRLRSALRGTQQWALRPLLSRARRLITVADFEARVYGARLRLSQDRFVRISNGCDLPNETIPARRRAPGRWIASVGRLEKYKGHHRVIESLPLVLERQPDARLWIVGEGPDKQRLLDLAERLGVKDQVLIEGVPPLERDRMAAEIKKMDLVILLSEYETHPVAALEAIALGRPVLTTNDSGFRELAEVGLVSTVERSASSREIADSILQQLSFPKVPAGIVLPSWEECADQHLALYKALLSSPDAGLLSRFELESRYGAE